MNAHNDELTTQITIHYHTKVRDLNRILMKTGYLGLMSLILLFYISQTQMIVAKMSKSLLIDNKLF